MNGHTEGFSMIELIMALVIAGIMMAVAVPKFTHVNDADIYTAARQVKSDIRYTQELAMSKYRQTTISFAPDSNTYTISGITRLRKLPPGSNAIFNAGSTLVFKFNAYGEPIDATTGALITGGAEILTISSGGFTEQIAVSNIAGKANIVINP